MTFGEKTLLWRQPKYERIEGKEVLMISANPYDTCSIGKTSLYESVLYTEARQRLGFGYEDWHFTLESNFHSIKHDVIPGSIKYTRIKPVSRLKTDRQYNSLMPHSAYIEYLISSF